MKSSESSLLEKRRNITDADRRQLTFVFTAGWAVLTIILFSLVVVMDYRRFESDFYEISQRIKDSLDARIAKNEAVLEGFASFLAGIDHYDKAKITEYARRINQRFPHVFMLEVATQVAFSELERLVERQRQIGYPDFQIRSFDYRGSRKWQNVPEAEYYYPITFIYPLAAESRPVLGLDLGSHQNMHLPLQRALDTGSYQTSLPFKLVEGYDAYVMFMPVQQTVNQQKDNPDDLNQKQPLQIVLVVLLQKQLLMKIERILPESMGALIYHSDKAADDPLGWLFNKPVSGYNLLPGLEKQYELEPEREGFMLRLEQVFGLNAVSVDVLACAAIASAFIFFFSRHFILVRYQRDMDRSKKEARLELLASYDPLTKLPNKNRFQEWLENGLESIEGDVALTAVLMDLENLKTVNEQFGHAAGDYVLQKIAERIQQSLDEDDLVARIGGNEFLAVLTQVNADEQVSEMVEKLTRRIQAPINYGEVAIFVKVDIGVAFYPEGASEPDQLIQLADKVMCQAKRRHERRNWES